jgi:hypothetical protein
MKHTRVRVNEEGMTIDGTSGQGCVVVTYATLVEAFGEPLEGDGYKTDAEWVLEAEGITATIYNWKNGRNYNGPQGGLDVENIVRWNVGGYDQQAYRLVCRLLGVRP